jgi:hypothetical protein
VIEQKQAGDETVVFRTHRDGSMTIIGLDGVVRGTLSKEELQGGTISDQTATAHGIILGMALGSVMWTLIYLGLRWLA